MDGNVRSLWTKQKKKSNSSTKVNGTPHNFHPKFVSTARVAGNTPVLFALAFQPRLIVQILKAPIVATPLVEIIVIRSYASEWLLVSNKLLFHIRIMSPLSIPFIRPHNKGQLSHNQLAADWALTELGEIFGEDANLWQNFSFCFSYSIIFIWWVNACMHKKSRYLITKWNWIFTAHERTQIFSCFLVAFKRLHGFWVYRLPFI